MDKSEYINMYKLETRFWWYKVLHELVDSSLRKTKPTGPVRMLDAGCGTGRMMEILQKHGTISGIDYSEDAVFLAKSRGLSNVEIGDLNTYNFGENVYDAIVCLDVLYHSGITSDTAVIEKFNKALNYNGILILNLPAFSYLKRSHDVVVHTKKRYRRRTFEAELKDRGFSILFSSYRMPHLYFIILISKLFRINSHARKSESDLKELPAWLNSILLFMGRIENSWLLKGFKIPVGSSLFIVARKSN